MKLMIDIEVDQDLINDFVKFRRETGADGAITADCLCSLPEQWSETAKHELAMYLMHCAGFTDTCGKTAKQYEPIKC